MNTSVDWLVFSFVILELLVSIAYLLARIGAFKSESVLKNLKLFTIIGLCVSGCIFTYALFGMYFNAGPISSISFVVSLLICGGYATMLLVDTGILKRNED